MKLSPTIYIICFTVTTIDKVYASAWLIEENYYRYTTTIASVDQNSRYLQQLRANLYIETYRKLQYLEQRIKLVNKSSALYNKLSRQIHYLHQTAEKLSAYQESFFQVLTIEYGINKSQNLGLQILYKNKTFQTTNKVNNFLTNNEISLFYKINLLHNANYIISIQPKIYMVQNLNYNPEWLYELLLLTGISKTISNRLMFIEYAIGLARSMNKSCNRKHNYSIATTEGIKLPYGIMLTSYSKYTVRSGYGNIYSKTLYTQLSVAKAIHSNKMLYSNLVTQIGYFWDKSLINKHYRLSGLVFSIWVEI